jgi:hypothetical protein
MRPARVVAVLVTVVAVVGLTSCYGTTEKATNVEFESATLNAHGTSNSGPAQSHFEYWPTADPANKSTTPTLSWPANISGPVIQSVSGLQEGTGYSFRVCGRDVNGGPAFVCAQTRTFETWSPDTASGNGSTVTPEGDIYVMTVDARSGPSGQKPSGTLRFDTFISGVIGSFDGGIDCLGVSGSNAIVVSTGTVQPGNQPATVYTRISATAGRAEWRAGAPDPNPTCALFLASDRIVTGSFSVTDAQPPPPPS